MTARIAMNVILIIIVTLSAVLLFATMPPGTCEEDEAYAVQIDRDPAHGLTWACENLEELIERSR